MKTNILPAQSNAQYVVCTDGSGATSWRGRPLLDLTWMAHAACGPGTEHLFVGPQLTSAAAVKRAKRICEDCPVWAACLEYAVATGQREGVWGGRSARQLARASRARRASR